MIQLFISIAFLSVLQALRVEQLKHIQISGLQREVDLTNKYIQIVTQFTLVNQGSTAVNKFYHTLPINLKDSLHYISLTDGKDEVMGKQIIDLEAESLYNVTVYEFTLKKAIDEKSRRSLTLLENFSGRYQLLPKMITLTEDQLVVFQDNVNFFTPYFVTEQQTKIRVNRIISYQPVQGAVERGSYIEYQALSDVKPMQVKLLRIHAENNKALVIFQKVKKTIEVSHWGNIAILEEFSIFNQGANLSGEFGRVVFNKYNPNAGKNALKELVSYLPLQTWGIYYRDEIGNISTSHAQRGIIKGEKLVKLQLNPRFPILGGWRANFQVGYNLPTSNYLQVADQDADMHVLTQTFGFGVSEMVAETYELVIILPEGASEIEHNLKSRTDSVKETLTFSYLDTTGRPTLVFTKHLVSDLDAKPFTIQYKFKSQSLFREPLMILGAFLVFFMSIIALGRLELVTLKLKND